MRMGRIIKVVPDRKFGFIRSDHFRDDVFFHFSVLRGLQGRFLEEEQEVEFEINEIMRMDEQRLEATLVQASSRPQSKTLDEKLIPEMQAAHHPRARQRKPSWRNKPSQTEQPDEAASEQSPQDDSGTQEAN